MPNEFLSPEGNLEKIFLDDYSLIDQYAKTGSVWCWGYDSNGQLGVTDVLGRSSPVQTVAGGTNWRQVDAGQYHTAAIKADGTLWLWGRNINGELGTNDLTDRSSPVQTIAGGNNWRQVACGSQSTAAIKTDDTLWVWGRSSSGRLGTNDLIDRSSPVQTIAGGNNWKQVSFRSHAAAIKTDGTLWVWGENSYGRLGTNDVLNRSSPVQTVAGGTNWKQVSCGYNHTAAIKTDGTLWTWGRNVFYGLGVFGTDRSSPVQIAVGGTNWKQVSAGNDFTAAIKTDGSLWCWGWNLYGQLGDNTRTNRSNPAQTAAAGTNWKQVYAGTDHTAAIKTDGTLWLWGRNNTGQLGVNNTADISSPVQTVAGGTNWKRVSAYTHTAAVHFYDASNLYPNS